MIPPPAVWRLAACLCAAFGLACGACRKEKETKTKTSKKPHASQAAEPRRALNAVALLLRELAEAPPRGATPAARAAALKAELQSVPATTLPDPLRAAWLEMTAVLEAAEHSGPAGLSDDLRRQGEAAAKALNSALAAQGLSDFRF